VDAADALGRWLEACGVSKVYLRPDGSNEQWLSRGEWLVLTVGEFVNRVRRNLYVAPAQQAPAGWSQIEGGKERAQ